jgi:hypothetical protein
VHRLREISIATVFSSYGRVDCLLERGRCPCLLPLAMR